MRRVHNKSITISTWFKPLLAVCAIAVRVEAFREDGVVVLVFVLHMVHHRFPLGKFFWPRGGGCCTPVHVVADPSLPLLHHLTVLLFSCFCHLLGQT